MKKILIVDNDRIVLKFLAKLLENEDHQVVTEQDGLNALDILVTYTPDVIFVDLIMPKIDGKTLCSIIRDIPKLKDTYLVVLSAIAAEEFVDVTELGADVCIAKGPLNEMGQHVLFVLEQPDIASSQSLSGDILGLKGVFPRGVTLELLEAKKHFEVVLEKMTEGILEINSEGRIVYVNKKALLLIGKAKKELLGSHFVELFSDDDHDYLRVISLMEMKGNKNRKISYDAPLRLNKYQVTLNILPLDEDESESIIILHDVTERKQAEIALRESEEKYRNILESIEDGYFEVDIDGNFTFFNDSMCKILGYPRDELMGMNYREYMDQENSKKIYQTFNKAFKTEIPTKALNWQFIRKDGSECFIETVVSLIKDSEGQPTGFRGIARDVTERKLKED